MFNFALGSLVGESIRELALSKERMENMRWLVNRQDNDSPLVVIAENGQWVCKVSTENNWAQQSEDVQKANAALIAAAPELLEKLEWFTDFCAACPVWTKTLFCDNKDDSEAAIWLTSARAIIARIKVHAV